MTYVHRRPSSLVQKVNLGADFQTLLSNHAQNIITCTMQHRPHNKPSCLLMMFTIFCGEQKPRV